MSAVQSPIRAARRVLGPFLRRRRDPEGRMSLLEHLHELRYRLIWVMGAVGVAAIAGWTVFEPVVATLLVPARPFLVDAPGEGLIITGPVDAFTLRLKVAIYVGFVIAFPVVLFHFWRFVSPGLHARERKYAIPFVTFGMGLFVMGIGFAYYTLPQAMRFLIGPMITGQDIMPMLTAKLYMDFVLFYLFAFGVAFEFPLVLMFLSLAGVISSRQMARMRRHVAVGIAVVSALITPPDWYSMVVMGGTLYVLYESCIWLSRLLKR